MSKAQTYENRTEEILLPIAAKNQVEIYDVEFVKEGSEFYLRAFIDKPGGVNINDCEAVSRALSDALDEKDFIADSYTLEVSSPGLGRQLKKDKHLAASLGQEVEIKTYKAADPYAGQSGGAAEESGGTDHPPVAKSRPRSKEFAGILKAFDGESITIETQGKELIFARADIANIRLAFDF